MRNKVARQGELGPLNRALRAIRDNRRRKRFFIGGVEWQLARATMKRMFFTFVSDLLW